MLGDLRQNQADSRPWQFSLRTMFLLTAGVAVCFALQRVIGAAPIAIAAIVSALFGVISWLDAPKSTKRKRLVIRRMLWCFGLTMVLATACIPEIHDHTPSRRSVCRNNLRQLALSVQFYEQSHGSLPPAYIPDAKGKPMHSWRVMILPYLERPDLLRAYNHREAWNGPNNRKLAPKMTEIFHCPSAGGPGNERTDYVAVTGPGTAWLDAVGAKVNDIRDPTKCILLIELDQSNIHWMEPRDITIQEAIALYSKPGAKMSGHSGGANVVFVDGCVNFLDKKTLIEVLEAMLPEENAADAKP